MNEVEVESNESRRGLSRWVAWTVGGLVAAVVLLYGGIFVYTEFVKDSPDEFDADDLAAALEEPAPDELASEEPPGEPADDELVDPGDVDEDEPVAPAGDGEPSPPAEEAPPAAESAGLASGTTIWEVTTESELGYRVKEILFGVDTEGVGRTNQIVGAMTIDGSTVTDAEFQVDVASITSDESRRDNQFRGRIMSTDEFPTAFFTLTEPIELDVVPGDGAAVETAATGELTLRGVTNPVTFDVTAQQEGERIGVLGAIPIVFADDGIANPSIGGITTEDNGLLEFVLVFEPA